MTPSPSNSASSAGFERFSLSLFAGGVAAAVLLLTAIPMPANAVAHTLTVLAILAAVAGSLSVLWHRHFVSYHAEIASRLDHAERELAAAEGMASVGRVAAGTSADCIS